MLDMHCTLGFFFFFYFFMSDLVVNCDSYYVGVNGRYVWQKYRIFTLYHHGK